MTTTSAAATRKPEKESLKSNLNPKFPAHIFLLVYSGKRREMEVRVEAESKSSSGGADSGEGGDSRCKGVIVL